MPAWQDVEVAVVLLYALGEALTDEVNADRCGAFQQPVALLVSGTIPHLEHRHVAGAVLECCVRFCCMHAHFLPQFPHATMTALCCAVL
jgi:hypothetical protein